MGCGASSADVELRKEAKALAPYVNKKDVEAVKAGLLGLKKNRSAATNHMTVGEEVNRLVTIELSEENGVSETTNTLLHMATKKNSAEMLEVLCEYDPDVNIRNGLGYTPLHVACITGASSEVMKLLIKKGGDVNATDERGNTPVHMAARTLSGWLLILLVENGADKEALNTEQETPLEAANKQHAQLTRRSSYMQMQQQKQAKAPNSEEVRLGTIDAVRDVLE